MIIPIMAFGGAASRTPYSIQPQILYPRAAGTERVSD